MRRRVQPFHGFARGPCCQLATAHVYFHRSDFGVLKNHNTVPIPSSSFPPILPLAPLIYFWLGTFLPCIVDPSYEHTPI